MSLLIQNVYPSRDNVTNLKFTYVDDDGDEQTLDLSPVVNCDLIIHGADSGSDVVARTTAGVTMTFGADGAFTAFLGDVSLDYGEFYVTMVVYDAGHPDGQVLIHRNGERRLMLRVLSS